MPSQNFRRSTIRNMWKRQQARAMFNRRTSFNHRRTSFKTGRGSTISDFGRRGRVASEQAKHKEHEIARIYLSQCVTDLLIAGGGYLQAKHFLQEQLNRPLEEADKLWITEVARSCVSRTMRGGAATVAGSSTTTKIISRVTALQCAACDHETASYQDYVTLNCGCATPA